MMNLLEEAIIYATIMHQGKTRKIKQIPYILHPLEVSQILSTMTDDPYVMTAGIMHDILERTDGTIGEIESRFGKRVAEIISAISEKKDPGQNGKKSWEDRKKESLHRLKISKDHDVKMVWLADGLANIRSLASIYSEQGEKVWESLDQTDSHLWRWYYGTIAEYLELEFNKTGAYKELIKHINFIWPGTYDSDKARFKKYKEVSLKGCKQIGSGAKGDVYRYDDELIIKVYNDKNTYKEVETEIALARKAFVLGIPTAISFGIVSVGDRYGAMYELLNSLDVSRYISDDPEDVEHYAKIMAELAHTIHDIETDDAEEFPDSTERLRDQVDEGLGKINPEMADRVLALIDALPETNHLVHGDFHSGNVFLLNGEPMLIDMDRLSIGHPIVDISGLYMAYVGFGDKDPKVVEEYMGFSYETAKEFFHYFLEYYLGTKDEARIQEVTDKAALMCYMRLLRRPMRTENMTEEDEQEVARLVEKTAGYLERVDSLLI